MEIIIAYVKQVTGKDRKYAIYLLQSNGYIRKQGKEYSLTLTGEELVKCIEKRWTQTDLLQ